MNFKNDQNCIIASCDWSKTINNCVIDYLRICIDVLFGITRIFLNTGQWYLYILMRTIKSKWVSLWLRQSKLVIGQHTLNDTKYNIRNILIRWICMHRTKDMMVFINRTHDTTLIFSITFLQVPLRQRFNENVCIKNLFMSRLHLITS